MKNDFAIYDALLWEPGKGYFLLEQHLRRLEATAGHFGFPLAVAEARGRLLDYARRLSDKPRKVRLELTAAGALALMDVDVKPSTPLAAVVSAEPVSSGDVFLRYKTSQREVFDRALKAHPEAQDLILRNERGELTETCHGNLVLELEGRKVTPPLASGLLPGVFRAHLLERGEIHEQVLPAESLALASAIFMINSVRRWCELRVMEGRGGSRECA
jgi:para-aminobenzoate synthetase/4-amino-4-deoxychorismate lyase